MAQFKAVFPISNENIDALPVKELDAAIGFYERVMEFSVVTRDSASVILKRDDVQIGLIHKEDHDPKEAGSCYFSVSDVESLRSEMEGKGGDLGELHFDQYEGKEYRVFFLREFDNGYCFCFGQPA
jgi:predicted enzyme related to lactoylglutathione lyase